MSAYLFRRLLTSLLVLFGVSILVFSIIHLVPGDPVSAMTGRQKVSAEQAAELRQKFGLNDPIPVQYLNYVSKVLHGDLGQSLRNKVPVSEAIFEQLPSTIQLAFSALILASVIGLILGVLAATRQGTWVDSLSMTLSVSGMSIPTFWLGLLFIFFFSVRLGLLPSTSTGNNLKSLILPTLTLGLPEAAIISRVVRASMLDVLNKEYITTARAKGLREYLVVLRHALRNALIPVVTFIGLQMGYLLAGSTIVESIFARQGIGRLAVSAIAARDYPMVQGVVLVTATVYVLINTMTDMFYSVINPQIRLK
jgi:ABC-type dipeptide/oligopeptide/nickel transport system permease component